MKDFTPTKETISLHGLGFIQVVLPGNQRLHVWHPSLPRRSCYNFSAIHNHRFAFESRVLKGVQKNVRVSLELVKDGTHDIISHNGPRSPRGGRLSYPVASCNVHEGPIEVYNPGDVYTMPMHDYHHTPNSGVVITVMRKLAESEIHANSVIRRGREFDYDFDRFQLSPAALYSIVVDAFQADSETRIVHRDECPLMAACMCDMRDEPRYGCPRHKSKGGSEKDCTCPAFEKPV